eukprot:5088805-Pyramimonas_sp.AAC.1
MISPVFRRYGPPVLLNVRLVFSPASEAEALQLQWQASCQPPVAEVPDRECFPRATIEEIRSAAGRFSQHTSSTLDGFLPRHMSLLGGAGLATLAVLYEAIERLGLFPRHFMWMVSPLIDKPAGGHRAILLLASFVR